MLQLTYQPAWQTLPVMPASAAAQFDAWGEGYRASLDLPALTREQWLQSAVGLLRPLIAEKAGLDVPDVHVSTGFPSRNALSTKSKSIGECWHKEASSDGRNHVFISPILSDGLRVLDVLAHELVHAALPAKAEHKAPFARAVAAIGLEGKPTATIAGEAFKLWSRVPLALLGAYPQPVLNAALSGKKKQATRLIKCECQTCGYTVRTTAKWIDDAGAPLCPCNGEAMQVESGKGE